MNTSLVKSINILFPVHAQEPKIPYIPEVFLIT